MASVTKPDIQQKPTAWKQFKWFIQHFDGIWSVPIIFFLFYFVGLFLTSFFGYGTGFYDPAFIQPLFLAGAVVVGATNMSVLGLYFTFRGLYRYIYGYKDKQGQYKNPSKDDWEKLSVWQRFIIAFGSFVFFVVAIIVVYLRMV